MKKLRVSFLGLILYLAVLFCLERVGWQEPALVYSAWINFWITLAAITLILLLPVLSRANSAVIAVMTTIFYLAVRFYFQWMHPQNPVFGGIFTYITGAQLFMLVIAVNLTVKLVSKINEIDDAIEDITLGNTNYQIQMRDKAISDIEREFVRSSRHHFPLSVIVVQPDAESVDTTMFQSVREIQQRMMSRFLLSRLVNITSNSVRRTDLIVNQAPDDNSFVVFSPDTSSNNAELLIKRIQTSIENQTKIKIHCGQATFPDEGLNFDDLVRIAYDRLQPESTTLTSEFVTLIEGDAK